jgi:hypothetical protein
MSDLIPVATRLRNKNVRQCALYSCVETPMNDFCITLMFCGLLDFVFLGTVFTLFDIQFLTAENMNVAAFWDIVHIVSYKLADVSEMLTAFITVNPRNVC